MIQFPETVTSEWRTAAAVAEAPAKVKQRIERGTSVENAVERLRINHEAKLIFQQELDAESTPKLEMMTLSEYRANPTLAPADLIEGVMKDNGLCTVLGPSGSGKSTIALQMAHSLATGTDWLGQKVDPTNGGVGILSYDMDASMVFDWIDGAPGLDPDKVAIINAYKRGNPIGVPALRQQIVTSWKGMGVDTVVVDSFSASFFGNDQNDAAATMAHYRDLKLFALTEVGARSLIVIVHSTDNNPAKARGSTAHKDVADTMVSVAVNQDGSRRISVEKYRAARGQEMMSPVIVTAPDAVTHLVSLDIGAMNLAGMPLPPTVIPPQQMFQPLPATHEDPQATPATDSTTAEHDSEDEGDDDL